MENAELKKKNREEKISLPPKPVPRRVTHPRLRSLTTPFCLCFTQTKSQLILVPVSHWRLVLSSLLSGKAKSLFLRHYFPKESHVPQSGNQQFTPRSKFTGPGTCLSPPQALCLSPLHFSLPWLFFFSPCTSPFPTQPCLTERGFLFFQSSFFVVVALQLLNPNPACLRRQLHSQAWLW